MISVQAKGIVLAYQGFVSSPSRYYNRCNLSNSRYLANVRRDSIDAVAISTLETTVKLYRFHPPLLLMPAPREPITYVKDTAIIKQCTK